MKHSIGKVLGWRLSPRISFFLVGAGLALLLAACGPSTAPSAPVATVEAGEVATAEPLSESPPATADVSLQEESDSSDQPAAESYPAPTIPTVVEAYPAEELPEIAALPEEYPPPADDQFKEPRFRIDAPVQAGSTVITGQAPPDMLLAIVDVTYNGELLGAGRSDGGGRFSINVGELVEGNRIGITFGELEPDMSIGDMSIKYYPYRGEGFTNLPNVGIMLDTVLVQP